MTSVSEICAGAEFRIAADGTWFHDGAPIRRARLVRLFASVLVRDEDGAYWLRTPVEKVPVAVEDAPFVAVDLAVAGTGRAAGLTLITNTGSEVPVDARHPIVVREGARGPRPYVLMDGGLEALIARPLYYRLAEMADTGPGGASGVWSHGAFFALEPAGEGGGGS